MADLRPAAPAPDPGPAAPAPEPRPATPEPRPAAPAPLRIAILADDLIWSTRLVSHVRSAGLEAVAVRTLPALTSALAAADAAIIDLTSRTYDGLAAIAAARDLGRPVLAVGQHDDHVLRRDALAVGADRVLAYRKLFDDGPPSIIRWLGAQPLPVRAGPSAPSEEVPRR